MDREISQVEFYDRFPEQVPSRDDVEEVVGFLSLQLQDEDDLFGWRQFDR
jgi:hypothetical protein